ncbi:MAG: N-6 DNA methylase [Gracilimonas sp.]|uniref:Eco57I restriction-modification methylase domain-containing protein n=1 Tax=Gracilimonas sp. TaxID=1974203 RepID=UPI0019991BCF|nr:N-6 DNA methylase [Gracilimonas sp.]MBD3616713.1 N-6 DNA methylase [Gracilimonas sp.]
MPLFQNAVLNKYLSGVDEQKVEEAWGKFTAHFHNAEIQENIRNSKEEEYQGGFLEHLFVNVLGYTMKPAPDYNLVAEKKNLTDSKKADGALLDGDKVRGVIELKGTETTDLSKVQDQAFGYKNNQRDAHYVIISNFEKLRFYIDNAVDFLEFNLFTLSKKDFKVLWLCLGYPNFSKGLPKKIKDASLTEEESITKKLYKDYSNFKQALFEDIVERNPEHDKVLLFKKTQKLLDRFLFIFFAEDRNLVPPNLIRNIIRRWTELRDDYDVEITLYQRFKKNFKYLNEGYDGKDYEVFAYNGGLFLEDTLLDGLNISDELLYEHTDRLSKYDFETEVDVNILGHIFEHSLNEIEEINAELKGEEVDTSNTRRKKDGVFYTPKYITKYIVENTVGKLCEEKKADLEIDDERFTEAKRRTKKGINDLKKYREWLLNITICDPACGSGAFLNQALEFLIAEHKYIDELQAKYHGEALVLSDIENQILEKNLFGVDINEESVEIAKLSLWLRTAQKGRKLTSLNNHIKCGNSLIDDPEVAGDKAFNWEKEFPDVFANGGFDVVIGNPPYLRIQGIKDAYPKLPPYYEKNFQSATGNYDIYVMFMERSYGLINKNGQVSFILPHKFLISEFGEGIREFLAEQNAVSSLLHFEEHLVFEVTTYTCIINFDKKKHKDLKFAYVEPQEIINPFVFEEMSQKNLSGKKWNLMGKIKANLFQKLADQPYTAEDIFEKIFVGLQTSADKIYLIEGDIKGDYVVGYSKSLDREVQIEKGLMKPQLKGQDVSKYCHLKNIYYVIFPYILKGDGTSEPMTEDYIKKHFPKGYEYLKENEKDLRGRESGKMDKEGWFLYIYPKSLTEFEQPKIVSQEISKGTNMTFDNENMYHATTVYSFILNEPSNEDYKYYLSILNSNLMWFYLTNTGTVLRGGYFRFKTKYLYPFPLPEEPKNKKPFIEKVDSMLELNKDFQKVENNFSELLLSKFDIDKLSKKLQSWHELTFKQFLKELKKKKVELTLDKEAEWMEYFNQQKAKANELKNQIAQTDSEIDGMVYELYGLTKEEIEVVEGS